MGPYRSLPPQRHHPAGLGRGACRVACRCRPARLLMLRTGARPPASQGGPCGGFAHTGCLRRGCVPGGGLGWLRARRALLLAGAALRRGSPARCLALVQRRANVAQGARDRPAWRAAAARMSAQVAHGLRGDAAACAAGRWRLQLVPAHAPSAPTARCGSRRAQRGVRQPSPAGCRKQPKLHRSARHGASRLRGRPRRGRVWERCAWWRGRRAVCVEEAAGPCSCVTRRWLLRKGVTWTRTARSVSITWLKQPSGRAGGARSRSGGRPCPSAPQRLPVALPSHPKVAATPREQVHHDHSSFPHLTLQQARQRQAEFRAPPSDLQSVPMAARFDAKRGSN